MVWRRQDPPVRPVRCPPRSLPRAPAPSSAPRRSSPHLPPSGCAAVPRPARHPLRQTKLIGGSQFPHHNCQSPGTPPMRHPQTATAFLQVAGLSAEWIGARTAAGFQDGRNDSLLAYPCRFSFSSLVCHIALLAGQLHTCPQTRRIPGAATIEVDLVVAEGPCERSGRLQVARLGAA
jgi:hypothetical protein